MRVAQKQAMWEAIEKHGRQLLAIFPYATERDPVELCKKLRRIERRGERLALQQCNGPAMEEKQLERAKGRILDAVDGLLRFSKSEVPVFFNGDPRGYALKIESDYMRKHRPAIETDWGGYGIIAPDLSPNQQWTY